MVGGVKRTKIAWIDDLTASIQSKVHCKIYEINALVSSTTICAFGNEAGAEVSIAFE